MVRRRDSGDRPKQQSLRPRGAGVYSIVDGKVVSEEDDDSAPAPPESLARRAASLPPPGTPLQPAPAPPTEPEPAAEPALALELDTEPEPPPEPEIRPTPVLELDTSAEPEAEPKPQRKRKGKAPAEPFKRTLVGTGPPPKPAPAKRKETLVGPGSPSQPPPAKRKETLVGPGSPSQPPPAQRKETLVGPGSPSQPASAKRKETLVGAGLGQAGVLTGEGPKAATMPVTGAALPPTDEPLPWKADAEYGVEVEIAPVVRTEHVPRDKPPDKPATEESAREPGSAEGERDATATKPLVEPSAEARPSDELAAAEATADTAPESQEPRRGRSTTFPVKWAAALLGLLVVAFAAGLLLSVGPVSIRIGGDTAEPHPPGGPTAPGVGTSAPTSPAPTAVAQPSGTSETPPEAVDGSSLPLHEGYLKVETSSSRLYVYGRGKRLGKAGELMRLRCGGVTVRLGDRAPEHWYSAPTPIHVACQEVTTETIETTDPISILEEGVPAETPRSGATGEAFVPPPPLPPPEATGTGSNWVPPSI